ncbi:hypothetical protein CXX84_14815 [Arthrobacter sp. AFG7.2]|nr:hypothetical protein CXX84_14815 [Arthrobacter sp. AFG7.2]
MLGTLFTGGLLALGCTAANVADAASGPDLSGSALISAAASVDSTSLGLLGGPTPSVSADVAAAVDVSLGAVTGSGTDATGPATAVVADVGLGSPIAEVTHASATGVVVAADAAGNVGSVGGGTVDLVNADANVTIGGNGTVNPGTTAPGPDSGNTNNTGTTGSGTVPGITSTGTGGVSTAPAAGSTAVGGAIAVDAASGSTGARGTPAQGTNALAKTGVDASMLPLALLLLMAGLLMLRKRKVS